jgi:long-chain acyl-CoA synthetase
MPVDLELYRQEVRLSGQPALRLSAIDIAPDHAQRTMVFLHGFGGKATQWQYQLKKFSDTSRVIAFDLRGHGRSDKPRGGYTMPQILDDLCTALDRLGVSGPFVLVGHSFGGAIATELACAYPVRISHLILIATAGEFRLNPLYRQLLRLPASTLQALAPFTRKGLGAPPHALKAMYVDSLSRWNGWNLFRGLTVPTLVIRGHHDAVFERPLFEEVTRAIPLSEEIDVGASGHMVMLERREAVNRAITRFIETSKPAFSQSETSIAETHRTRLMQERPWLRYYEENVPSTIAVPHVPLQSLLESAARRFPHKTALVFEGSRISYQRLNQKANRFANFLSAQGIEKGERVMILLPNIPQLVVAFFGALKAGAVVVFTIPTTQPDELIRQIRDSGARVLVTLAQFDELIGHIKTQLEPDGDSPLQHIVLAHVADHLPLFQRLALRLTGKGGQEGPPSTRLAAHIHIYKQIMQAPDHETQQLEFSPRELAVIHYTGGTTAQPKGVMLSHLNLVANALQTRHWVPDAVEGQERFLCVLPFSHSYGLTAALNVPVALGATLLLKPRFDVQDILKTIQKHHPTIFPGVPQMYVAIRDFPGVRKYGISSIKACISGSAPLPVEVQEAFEKLTRGRLVEGYGLTEASPVTHANPLNGLRKVGSIGIPLPSTQARVVDLIKSNIEVPVGQIGELAVKGPQVMLGYWQNDERARLKANRHIISPDGWLLTGDVAQMDGDGYFRIIARKADMWYPTKPGDPAFPRDVEEVLFEVPQVREAAVVAIAGQPIAFVISGPERPGAEALIAYCKRRLPPEIVPRVVIFVDDFPRTFIGKVLRRELTRLFEESKRALDAELG